MEKTGDPGLSSPAGEEGRKGPQTSGRKEAPLKAAAALGAAKGGARTGSCALEGAGVAVETVGGKKLRLEGQREEEMDSVENEEGMTGGGLGGGAVMLLGFDSGQPSCLFGPASPQGDPPDEGQGLV